MPVLRSREVPFHPTPPKTPRKRKPSTPPSPPPSPSINPHTPSSEDVSSRNTPVSSSLGLGLGRPRRSLRLAAMGGFERKVDCMEEAGESGRKRNGEGEEIGEIDLNLPVMDVDEEGKSAVVESIGVGWIGGIYTREEKGKMVVEDAGMDVEGEGILAAENVGGSSLFGDAFDGPLMDWEKMVPVVDAEAAAAAAAFHNEVDRRLSRRDEDRARALEAAPKFALFSSEESPVDKMDEDNDEDGGPVAEDWPGPFATAKKILNDREDGVSCWFPEVESSQVEIHWTPSAWPKLCRVAPSLISLGMDVLAENADAIESLEGIPDKLRHQLTFLLCRSRKLDYRFLSLLSSGRPTEICVGDCSWATEEGIKEIFSNCNTEELEVLKLDLSGRCMPDYVLRSTLAQSPNSLPKLNTVSLSGNYRLSDDGLYSLVCSAPMLCSVNLSQCSLLTSTGITSLAEKLEAVLRELILDSCSNVNALTILPALKKLKNLEKLSVCGVESVNCKFVSGLLSVHGPNIKALGFAGCGKVSLNSIKVIGQNCLQLCELDLRNLHKVDDNAIRYLAKACVSVRKLKFQHSNCSDEAVAAFLDASGRCLQKLSLKHFKKVGHETAVAICRRCTSLQNLDLSFCRMMTNEALGLIVDSCSSLKILKLFGCTEVTELFLNGHSNPHVEIIGLQGSILKHLDNEPGYC